MSSPAASKTVSNALIAGTLGAFCVGVYTYTMRAVGRDDLDVAVAKREAAAQTPEQPAAAAAAKKAK